MQNYSNPTVWNEFLEAHNLDSGTPPPDESLCEEISNMSDENLSKFLTDYAHLRGSSWRRQRNRMDAAFDRLIESGEEAP